MWNKTFFNKHRGLLFSEWPSWYFPGY